MVATQAVPTRRLSFDDTFCDVPRHFASDEDLLSSHLAAALSALFPEGEEFFVRSVRRFRDQVEDPQLKRQVAGFIGQEAVHGREHRVFNDRLAELGYPAKKVEALIKWSLGVRERLLSPRSNLAATAALEHFTATLAETLLSSEELRASFGHEAVLGLFVWHALEESEHKAVAFDVYRAVGGTERMRVLTMDVFCATFFLGLAIQMGVSLARDPATFRRGNLADSWRRFRRSPLWSKELWRRLRDYNRPGFHPNDRDTTELVAHWREALFGQGGTLTERLPRPATRPAQSARGTSRPSARQAVKVSVGEPLRDP